ncbi:MAG TPA: ABC transporter substrate-binding protein [Candidatus Deferrimicrobium sp.]|nr:ABC transporter substrate-binding protein [Candidatus Deferrimicrobium sp.]
MFWLRAIQFALLTFCVGSSSFTASRLGAANAPVSAAQIALYQGTDREKLLIEGAKKEGQVVFYNSHTWFKAVAQEFEKKYPFIKVAEWRADGADVMKRVIEENRAGRFLTDVVESTAGNIGALHKNNLLQEHASPELRFFDDDVVAKGKRGVFYWADRETYISLGFNTTHVAVADAPKRLNDLLDPRLKGKMSLAGGATSARWVGAVVESAGREFIEKLGRHDINVHKLSGAALANLVVTGEVPISPTIFDSNIFVAKRKGAPVEWLPVEPVIANVGYSGIVSNAPHPHAALLLIDYLHSKEGQQFIVKGGLSSPRDDVESLVNQKFKKVYFEAKYSVDEYEKKLSEWEELIQKHFIRKR